MTDNLEIWNKVSRVPAEHLKAFNNGRFSGTAIKPMWFIKTATEQFGPCGSGWFTTKPEFQIIDAGESKLVYCTIGVWVKGGQQLYGVGGDWVVRNGRGEDEAFKKAYTDALTNALVKLGVGADIHMGLWDGNKYIDDAPPAGMTPPPIHNASKSGSRETFHQLCKEVRDIPSLSALNAWKMNPDNIERMESLNADFADTFRNTFKEHVAELKGRAAA